MSHVLRKNQTLLDCVCIFSNTHTSPPPHTLSVSLAFSLSDTYTLRLRVDTTLRKSQLVVYGFRYIVLDLNSYLCCSVLQCGYTSMYFVAVCWSVLECVAECCSVWQCVAVWVYVHKLSYVTVWIHIRVYQWYRRVPWKVSTSTSIVTP